MGAPWWVRFRRWPACRRPGGGAIPWLLLKAASAQGDGVLGDVDYIQRLDTAGGVSPPGPCDADEDATISVGYRALYRFYAATA